MHEDGKWGAVDAVGEKTCGGRWMSSLRDAISMPRLRDYVGLVHHACGGLMWAPVRAVERGESETGRCGRGFPLTGSLYIHDSGYRLGCQRRREELQDGGVHRRGVVRAAGILRVPAAPDVRAGCPCYAW